MTEPEHEPFPEVVTDISDLPLTDKLTLYAIHKWCTPKVTEIIKEPLVEIIDDFLEDNPEA